MFIKHSYFAHFLLLFIAEQILEVGESRIAAEKLSCLSMQFVLRKIGQEKLVLVKCQKMHLSHHKYLQNETFFPSNFQNIFLGFGYKKIFEKSSKKNVNC